MLRRALDVALALLGLILGSVVLLPAMLALWIQDRHSPLYFGIRAAAGGGTFRMVKLRSMRVAADATGATSTAADDPRITPLGRIVRRWKVDELPQLWNVLKGEMSLVGPRPQVLSDVARFTAEEREILTVRPGLTDLASIVFADEGEIVRGARDPDARYDELIRPWKSRLALLYARRGGALKHDLRLMWYTAQVPFAQSAARAGVSGLVRDLGGGEELVRVASRIEPLRSAPPPGVRAPAAG